MSDSVLKALGKETKALIIVSEFEARRMPMFQLRAVFEAIIRDEQEKKLVIDLIDNDLRATGYPPEQIGAFLTALMTVAKPAPPSAIEQQILATRKLRSPFTMGFDAGAQAADALAGYGAGPALVTNAMRTNMPPVVQPPVVPPPAPPPAANLSAGIRPTTFRPQPDYGTLNSSFPPSTYDAGDLMQSDANESGFMPRIEAPPPIASDLNSAPPSGPNVPQPPAAPPATQYPAATQSYPPAAQPYSAAPSYPPVQRSGTSILPPMPTMGSTPKPVVADAMAQRRATFSFEPAKPSAPAPAPNAIPLGSATDRTSLRQEALGAAMANAAPAPGGKPLVVLADDDKRARMIFRLRLEEAGFNTVEFGTGSEAWERILQGGVSAAVLDMKMPGLHGLEVLSHMTERQMRIPVVICSAYDQLEDEFVVQNYPKLKYLVKPVAPEKLVQVVKDIMA